MERSMASVFKIAIFVLIVTNVSTNSEERSERLRRNYFDYRNFNDQSSPQRSDDREPRAPVKITWKWPFNQQNTIKVTGQPQISDNDREIVPNDKFFFPDETVAPLKTRIGTQPMCKGETFCEDAPNYPTDLVNHLIQKNPSLQNYASVDAMDDISPRTDALGSEQLCLSTEQIIYPKLAITIDNVWLFVLNHQNFTQGVRVEKCITEGQKCNVISDFAHGYETSCEQSYIYRELAAVAKERTISRELFRFPASCCCHIKFDGTSLRIGTNVSFGLRNIENNVHMVN